MKYNLAQLTRRTRNPRRSEITLRKIIPPATLASNLYARSYAPVIAAWNEASPAILASYERALAALTTDSPADLGAQISGAERYANSILVNIRLGLGAWASTVEKWQREKWRGAVLTATGVDIGTMIGAHDMRMPIDAAIERNVGLVKSVSDQLRQRISQAVFDGLRARKAASDVAREIRAVSDISTRRARNIASDQLRKVSSELASERRRQAGIDIWEWVSSGAEHFRPEHQAIDGNRYSDDNPPADLPGELINCGCTERAVLSLSGEF